MDPGDLQQESKDVRSALASAVIVTTPSARRLYIERYPHLPASRFRIIANGVDDTMDGWPSTRCASRRASRSSWFTVG